MFWSVLFLMYIQSFSDSVTILNLFRCTSYAFFLLLFIHGYILFRNDVICVFFMHYVHCTLLMSLHTNIRKRFHSYSFCTMFQELKPLKCIIFLYNYELTTVLLLLLLKKIMVLYMYKNF